MPITTLLFDLDDTLLSNDINKFIQPYLQSFGEHVADLVHPQKFIGGLLAGTQAMLANDDPTQTLEQVFGEVFYPSLDLNRQSMAPYIDSFYAQKFSALKAETRLVAAARETMAWAFAKGYKVVIATNALFPRSAILQRLEWAGVSAAEFPYALITTLEFMHFAKPHPEYFAEILARVDSRPEETLMVGNDWSQDIAPAARAGVQTFWINDSSAAAADNHAHPVGAGTLADFLKWATTPGNLDGLTPLPPTPSAVRAQQAAALATLFGLTENGSLAEWSRRPRESEWSLTEIACHLRDTEIEINLPRLQIILNESNPFISAIEADLWAVERDYQSQPGRPALTAFAESRREKIALLDRLTPADWQRPARHAIFGPTTLQELVTFTVEHDRLHLRQMRENLTGVAL